MHKYGYIADSEAALIDGLLADIKTRFGRIQFLEIGVYELNTAKGIYQRAAEINCPVHCEGIDVCRRQEMPNPDYVFHEGDSLDVWRTIQGEFNLLFIDGCHCRNHVMADFLNYSPMVVVNGYVLFHDSAVEHLEEVTDKWAVEHSYPGKPTSAHVREALRNLGILQGYRADWKLITDLIETDMMGMCLFQKIKPLV